MIQYPKHEHMTLGSVENWGSNMNILRDPPKSIFTRRIDKVGQNTDITELIDASDDRAAEGINVYARGVNPMVSVSYNNQSNNAGISGNPTATSGRTQAFLPYTIMNEGAFRPPVRNPRDLIPLSRLPRVWFSANALPSAVDYSKTKQQPSNYRAVKDASDMVKAFDIRPNQSANISVKSLEHFRSNPKTAINERHINVSASAGIKERDTSSYTRENADRAKGALEQSLKAFAQSNKTMELSHNLENLSINEKKYIQEYLAHEGRTNPSKGVAQGLDNLSINEKKYIQAYLAHEGRTNPSKGVAQGLDNLSIDEKKYIQNHLNHEGNTNLSKGVMQNLDNLSIDEKQYIQKHLNHESYTNLSKGVMQNLDNLSINQKQYIQEVLKAQMFANRSSDINTKGLDELNDNGRRVTVKDNIIQFNTESGINPGYTFVGEMATPELDGLNLPQHSRTTQISDSRVHHRVAHEKDLSLNRPMPLVNATSNISKIEDLNSMTLSSRDARLQPTLQKGGFQNVGNMPSVVRADLISVKESDKDRLRQSVNQQFNRFTY